MKDFLKPHLRLIRFIGVIVPRRFRARFRQEWEAELEYREALLARWRRLDWRNKLELLRRSSGAFWDALLLQPRRLEDEMFQDLRFGLRMLLKNPGFTLVAALTLALGIGVNTALFTLFNAVALRPLPVKDPDHVVKVYRKERGDSSLGISGSSSSLSYPEYTAHRDNTQSFAGLTAYADASLTLSGAEAEGIRGLLVAGNYFSTLGAEMALGRAIAPEECQTPGASPVVVLSHSFWRRRLGADPSLVGKTLTLNRQPFTVIGVTSPDFHGAELEPPDAWAPLTMQVQLIPGEDLLPQHNFAWLEVVGRLKPGVSPAQAQAEMMLGARQLDLAYPGRKTQIIVAPGNFLSNPRVRNKVFGVTALLMAAVGLVLLIACANVANLSLARAATRQKEIAVRLALGASRLRIVRQLLTESALISVIGGLAGLLAASWILRILYHVLIARLPEFPPYLNLQLDYRIFGFTMLAAISAGVAAGLIPALQASRPDLTSALKDEGSIFGQHLSQSRLRNGLVVTEIAMSLTLLIGAGLLARHLQKAQTIDIGFEPQNLLSVAVNLNAAGAQSAQQRGEVRRLLAERLRALPGVKSVSQAFRQPSSGQLSSTQITIAGRTTPDNRRLRANYNFVSSQHFETLGIRIVRGRSFTEQEANDNAPVVVISEATAQKFWPGQDAIGQHIGIAAAISAINLDGDAARGPLEATVFPSYEVIGVARNTRSGWVVWDKDETYLYMPLGPDNHLYAYLLIRAAG